MGGLQSGGKGHYCSPLPFTSIVELSPGWKFWFLFCSLLGDGDMAVSNTVGSNTFDVLFSLGVPWLIKATVWNAPFEVSSRGLFVSCFFIAGSVVIALLVLYLNSWVLNKKIGCIFLVIYFIFLGASVSMEMFVFGRSRLPMCNIEVWTFFLDNHFHLVRKGCISRLWSWKRFCEQTDKMNFAIPWAGEVVATSFPGSFSFKMEERKGKRKHTRLDWQTSYDHLSLVRTKNFI